MSYLEDFPVKTFQPQEREQESMESDQGCGEKWQGSFAKYDPDTHSLRTHQCSLLEDLTESCQTLPAWGLMRDGECWEQPTLALRIKETEFGLLPTPKAQDSRHASSRHLGNDKHWESNLGEVFVAATNSKKMPPNFCEAMMGWPLEWTDLKPLEMDKFQQWQQQHGIY